MTVKELLNACSKHRYILVRHERLGLVGMNCAIANLTNLKKGSPNEETWIQGFLPCSFSQYLSNKRPIL